MKVEEGVESGPGIGEVLPDFTLPDQWGKAVNFKAAGAGKKGLSALLSQRLLVRLLQDAAGRGAAKSVHA
jgi:hypothetical protein